MRAQLTTYSALHQGGLKIGPILYNKACALPQQELQIWQLYDIEKLPMHLVTPLKSLISTNIRTLKECKIAGIRNLLNGAQIT